MRLAVPPSLAVSIYPSWNSSTRNITAQVDVNILSNLSNGDYRISLYVVEDSVTGSGNGYDQENFYDASPPGNPFFGMGNPIAGYVHRHVVRATLPVPLGQAGIIPAAPTTGQNFTATFNYTLPVTVNENKTFLVAFVYRYSAGGPNNEVLNVSDTLLTSQVAGVNDEQESQESFSVFPNPSENELTINIPMLREQFTIERIEIYNLLGQSVFSKKPTANSKKLVSINISQWNRGIYFLRVFTTERKTYQGKIIVLN